MGDKFINKYTIKINIFYIRIRGTLNLSHQLMTQLGRNVIIIG